MYKTILLTGATGFLGSHLLKKLIDENYNVILLKRSFSDTWRIDKLLNKVKHYNLDEIISLEVPFKEYTIDAVIHAATNYGRKGEKTTDIIKDNLLFPIKLLETTHNFNIDIFINTDTFFNKFPIKYDYLNDYTLSKKHFVDWGKNFASAKKLKFINLKLEHIYGPMDNENKFVPWIINQLKRNVPEIKLTRGQQKRDFIYVEDVVNSFCAVLNSSSLQGNFYEFQVGTGITTSVKEFVTLLKTHLNTSSILNFGALNNREGEIMESFADNIALKELGWSPLYNLENGLKNTIK